MLVMARVPSVVGVGGASVGEASTIALVPVVHSKPILKSPSRFG